MIYNQKQVLALELALKKSHDPKSIELVQGQEYRSFMYKIDQAGNKTPIDSSYKEIQNWKDWNCYAGLENFVVMLDGKI